MSIEEKGWTGGAGSAADAMWDDMWSGGRGNSVARNRVTDGPLAQFNTGMDPLTIQASLRAEYEREFGEKTARIVGGDNSFDSSTSPGGNRSIQQDTSAGGQQAVSARPEDSARAPVDASSDAGKAKGAPSKGAVGAAALRRAKGKSAARGDGSDETGTSSVGPQGASRSADHGLQVRNGAPVPKELDPERRVGNLADRHEKSSWTGSGPRSALHDDYSKTGGLETDLVGDLLKLAGVPERYELPETSALFRFAAAAADIVKTASGNEYLMRDDVHPLKLVAELDDMLGGEWTEWEPETIRQTVIKEAGVQPSDDVMAKIMAVKIVLARPDRFFDDWHAFEKISVALNDQAPVMNSVEDVPVEWLSNAVAVVEKIASSGDFSPEVGKYVAARLFDQGYVVAPTKLAFADGFLGTQVGNDDLRRKVILAYPRALASESLDDVEETPVNIQVSRLVRNHAYVLDRLEEGRAQIS